MKITEEQKKEAANFDHWLKKKCAEIEAKKMVLTAGKPDAIAAKPTIVILKKSTPKRTNGNIHFSRPLPLP